jgi:hypothetical protein
MAIMIHPHAWERMQERGVTEAEVRTTISKGEKFPAKFGRTGFRYNFSFKSDRDGKIYGIELLNAKEQLIKEKKISFTDESTSRAFEVPLKF